MKKGDIILVPFPFTDLSGNKLRPALVLVNEGDDVIAAFISTILKQRFRSDFLIKKNAKNSLKKDSLIKLNKLATLSHDLVKGKIGEISGEELKEVDKKLLELFNLKLEPDDASAPPTLELPNQEEDSTHPQPDGEKSTADQS
jgi:mRNA interferase MazF